MAGGAVIRAARIVKNNHALSSQEPGKVAPITPDQENGEQAADERQGKTFRRHECVKENDIYNNRAEDNQTEGDPTEKEESAADELKKKDDVKISGGGKGGAELLGRPTGRRRHVDEMEESIQTEDNEDQPKQQARDDRGNFHESETALAAPGIQ